MWRQSLSLIHICPVIRKDWLDDLGLEVPETIEEWHRALLLFKEKKGASCAFVPTTVNSLYPFFGAYGVWPAFYQENGRVKHGVLDAKNSTAALENLHRWYQEGIIDPVSYTHLDVYKRQG